jgi:tetratricopeptide (TPR) repeat protein
MGALIEGRLRAVAIVLALVAVALGGITWSRSRLVGTFNRAKVLYDVYALPKPEHVRVMSLGYRSALADVLFAHVLVSSGIHLAEKRRYESAASYLRTINELDPKFYSPYRYADTILTMQSVKPRLEDYVAARSILERGMQEFKSDMALWLSAGQFMAYLAPPHVAELAGQAVAEEWRREGARRLARSCELVGKDENAPHHCVTAAHLLSKSGELEALTQFVERVLAVNDDPEVQRRALASLAQAVGEDEERKLASRRQRYDRLRARGLYFVGKDRFLLIGPGFDALACLDRRTAKSADCATSLAQYHERLDQAALTGLDAPLGG